MNEVGHVVMEMLFFLLPNPLAVVTILSKEAWPVDFLKGLKVSLRMGDAVIEVAVSSDLLRGVNCWCVNPDVLDGDLSHAPSRVETYSKE